MRRQARGLGAGTKLARAVVRLDHPEAIKYLERKVGEVGRMVRGSSRFTSRSPSLWRSALRPRELGLGCLAHHEFIYAHLDTSDLETALRQRNRR